VSLAQRKIRQLAAAVGGSERKGRVARRDRARHRLRSTRSLRLNLMERNAPCQTHTAPLSRASPSVGDLIWARRLFERNKAGARKAPALRYSPRVVGYQRAAWRGRWRSPLRHCLPGLRHEAGDPPHVVESASKMCVALSLRVYPTTSTTYCTTASSRCVGASRAWMRLSIRP